MERYEGKLHSKSNATSILKERKDSIRALTQGLAKIPPHAREVEEAVLGALLIEKSVMVVVSSIVQPCYFYDDRNVRVFEAMQRLATKNSPIDLITVSNELRTTAELELCGGLPYLVELTNKVNSAANVEFHARIISEYALKRGLISVGCEIEKFAYEDSSDVFVLLDKIQTQLIEISKFTIRADAKPLGSYKEGFKQQVLAARLLGGISGVATGFSELDMYTSGWQKGHLIIMAGRPGMGKTLSLIQMAKNGAKHFGVRSIIFELEMSGQQLFNRVVSSEEQVTNAQIKRGEVTDEQLDRVMSNPFLDTDNILVDDFSDVDIITLRAKLIKYITEHKVQICWIDYLQLMDGEGNNREQIISKISRALKKMAKDFQIPIVALAQLSRNVEQRGGDKIPQLSDLRESGSLEQDADMVIFNYRPEYYKIEQDEQGHDVKNKIMFRIGKHRDGALGDVWLHCDLANSTICDLDAIPAVKHNPIALPANINGAAAFEHKKETPF